MIKYKIKNQTIEITYDTGLELKYIMKLLQIIDILNEVRK